MILRGEYHPGYKGGRILVGDYVRILDHNHRLSKFRYVLEHRLVWERIHKASLLPWSVVHHKNGIKSDNRAENLEAMTRTQHIKMHTATVPPPIRKRRDLSYRRCIMCETDKTFINRRGLPEWRRHPITKQKWICLSCCMRIQYRLEKENNRN